MARVLRDLPVRFSCLIAAILLYAILSSPTPDHPGWVEASIGGLLLCAAGPAAIQALKPYGSFFSLRLFFLYGISIPTIAGFFQGHDGMGIARDGIAFLFLCLPLFFTALVGQSQRRIHIYMGALMFLGLSFSLRALAPVYGYAQPSGELYYLTNAPTVLCAAIIMGGIALRLMARSSTLRNMVMAVGAAAIVMIIIWAMLLDVQRATIAAVILSVLFFTGILFVRAPRRVVLPVILIAVMVALFYPVVSDAVGAMAHKTAQVGLNMRLEEVRAVIDSIDGSLWTALFGVGWGATMASPAVGGVSVAFTHSLLSYVLLKTGFCGLALTIGWLAALARKIISISQVDNVLGAAAFWTVAIPVFLYASHKSLDFGLILLLVTVLADGGHARLACVKARV